MPYGEIVHVRAPVEAYHVMHNKILEILGPTIPEGVVLHVARPTDDGFEIFEVWHSKDQADAFNRDVLPRAMAELGADASGPPPEVISFEPITAVTYQTYSSEQLPT